jgi:hypothetical protein
MTVEIRYIKCLGYGRRVKRVYERTEQSKDGEIVKEEIKKSAPTVWLQAVGTDVIESFPKDQLVLFPDGGLIVNCDWLFRRSRVVRDFVGLPLKSTERALSHPLKTPYTQEGPACLFPIEELYERFYNRFDKPVEIADTPFDGWYDTGMTPELRLVDWGDVRKGETKSLF